ncbi:MAG TPA: twin-arginine translocase subunit TatC [Solirubrobacteraceae bacterium]|jgi:sec-independent protein translocase protein TatC|nr:twin-arginine translocase subunit TatC [Solirubrobacteraceae bacterium]
MAAATARIGHQERASVVEHLDELRARLIVSLVAVAIAFGFCMWQNHALLKLVNAPLAQQTRKQVERGHGTLGATFTVQQGTRSVAVQLRTVVAALERPGSGASPAVRAALAGVAPALDRDVTRLAAAPEGDKPVTLGIGEPFTTTIGIAFLFALVLSLPVVLYELYAFLIPAFAPEQQRIARPLLAAIPFLFATGVVFGYFVVLPAAVRFFQNFNSDQFNVLVQASQYYHFAAVTLLAMGLVFQVPVAILAATRSGVVTPQQLGRNRRYALLGCAGVAALLPGDAITLLLETAPLYLLFEASVLLARIFARREAA